MGRGDSISLETVLYHYYYHLNKTNYHLNKTKCLLPAFTKFVHFTLEQTIPQMH